MPPSPGSSVAASARTPSRRVAPRIAERGRRVLRQHWLLLVVLAGATALRVVVLLAYQPALIFPDSERYLAYAQLFINWALVAGLAAHQRLFAAAHPGGADPQPGGGAGGAAPARARHRRADLRGPRPLRQPALARRAGNYPGAVRPAPARHRTIRPHRRQRDVPADRRAGRAGVEARRDRPGRARGRRAAARRRHGHQAIRPDRDHPRRALPGGRRPALAPLRGAGVAAARRFSAPRARLSGLVPGDRRPVRLRQL